MSRSLLGTAALATGLAAAGIVSGGCDRKEDIRVYNAPKAPPKLAIAEAGNNVGAEAADAIHWTLPDQWKQLPGAAPPRYATIAVTPDDPAVVLTVTSFPRSGLLENVNRWAGQLGLPPLTEADLPSVVSALPTAAGEAALVDLTGPSPADAGAAQRRMLAAMLPRGRSLWFFKLDGPAPVVELQKPKFEAFVQSVHFDAAPHEDLLAHGLPEAMPGSGELPANHPPIGPGAVNPARTNPAGPAPANPAPAASGQPSPSPAARGIAKYAAPAGWIQAGAGGMRLLSFRAPAGDAAADVSVIRLGAGVAILDNVNRWRGQVGLPPAADVSALPDSERQPVTVSGAAGMLFDFAGPQGSMMVALVPQGDSEWYIKMAGPAPAVSAHKEAFKAFLASLKF